MPMNHLETSVKNAEYMSLKFSLIYIENAMLQMRSKLQELTGSLRPQLSDDVCMKIATDLYACIVGERYDLIHGTRDGEQTLCAQTVAVKSSEPHFTLLWGGAMICINCAILCFVPA